MLYRIIAIIKPTKNNKAVMKKRGLFSDDHHKIFDIYEAMYNDEKYEIDANEYDFILEELTQLGIKY